MSSRQPADRRQIERFLRLLGERFNHPCRIYLVGGTTMVLEGFRDQSIDIDLTYEVDNSHHDALVQTIRKLKDELHVNVEEASPADFIPLPRGVENRAVFVGRFGQVDVFHFDLYSTALSKMARGSEEDLNDVVKLLRAGRIEMALLEKFHQEIRPQLATVSLKQDPGEFDRNLQAVRQLFLNSNHLR